ncbi:alpha/beta fold hydrolase [Nocardia sp. SYP-A9097]|uniref:alpha/beta hydrolase n=1 Tax=Nocardia sp. SYP-A9097 TaxID=2663237 RepID=UPI00129A53E3|nr:alpha/beta hydrolase [Nocardia sp. SYP-A9097]MRH86765.1 alpha/beta fold hydrolase [Nocardia sp. SYP-A9097]
MKTNPRWQRPLLAAALAAAIALALAPATAAADAPTTTPTIVFVHGAFADSSGWNATIADLRGRGYSVLALDNPLRGVASDAAAIHAALQAIPGPIVLVGHSYGGAVITNAARDLPNVRSLVYVGAFVPDSGENITTVVDPIRFPGALLGPATLDIRPRSSLIDADVYIKEQDFAAVFAADVPPAEAARMAKTQHPLALIAQLEPSGQAAWHTVPSWDLITLDDKAIPPAGQEFMAARAGAHIERVHSSHAVMVSHPEAVTAIVLDAVAALDQQ